MKKLLILVMLILLTACGVFEKSNNDDEYIEPQVDFSVGEIKDRVYINEFLNSKIDLDLDWYIPTDKELAELNASSVKINDENAKQLLEENNSVLIFYAINLINGESINIMVDSSASDNLKPEQLIKNNIDILEETYKNQGYDVETNKMIDIEFVGENEKGILTSVTLDGPASVTKRIGIVKGKYFVVISISSNDEARVDEIISKFSKIK